MWTRQKIDDRHEYAVLILLRSTYPQWTGGKRFGAMLDRAFVPLIFNGMPTYNGNWELSMCNALTAIGVFTDNQATFDQGVLLWRKRVPAYFYLTSDGPLPVRPYNTNFTDEKLIKYWHNPGRFVDGLCQETGRMSSSRRYVLSLSCPDRIGIVAAVSSSPPKYS